MTQRAWLGLAILVAGALVGCHRSDSSIAAQVQSKVNTEVKSPTADIEVAVDNGVVTLSGTVPAAPFKVQAEQAVRKVEGVTEIKDELQVNPTLGSSIPGATPTADPIRTK
jgi:osmotically-inducible protein OsmY